MGVNVSVEIQCAGVQRQSHDGHIIILVHSLHCTVSVSTKRVCHNVNSDSFTLSTVVFVSMLLEHHVYSTYSYLKVTRGLIASWCKWGYKSLISCDWNHTLHIHLVTIPSIINTQYCARLMSSLLDARHHYFVCDEVLNSQEQIAKGCVVRFLAKYSSYSWEWVAAPSEGVQVSQGFVDQQE